MKKIILLSFSLLITMYAYNQTSKEHTVAIKLSILQSPLRFQLRWNKTVGATQYKVFSKAPNALSWTERATLPSTDTSYTDSTVTTQGIEYQVVMLAAAYNAYGYLYAGQNIDEYNYRGKLLLLVDSNYKQPLSAEIAQLQADLNGDGWQTITRYIPRTATPPQVKQHITQLWQSDSLNFKSVYLLGRIPVPYSGYIGPDGHPEHYGAWPADLYYAVPGNSQWTDHVLNVKVSSSARHYNIPNDGKFDVDYIIPGSAKLQVGRVDMFRMPAFGLSDTLLTRRYLNKAHNFKINKYGVVQRGLIEDEIGAFGGEVFVRGGWGSYAGMFGDSVREAPFISELKTRPYMFATTAGFGTYTNSSGVVETNDFVVDSFVSPFTSYFGSYFGDWDTVNNLLRAGLASKSLVLTATWSGRPVFYYHQMALGQTVGYSALQSANSPRNLYYSMFASNGVHMALMGDPSLRLHPITPVTQLTATPLCTGVKLKWAVSTDTGITAYRIYRANTLNDKFEWVATVATDSFEDKGIKAGKYIYMVKALRLQKTPAGTYNNLSLGVIDSVTYYPAPKPVILLTDTAKCQSVDNIVIKNGITDYPFAYTSVWKKEGVIVPYNDSIILSAGITGSFNYVFTVNTPNGCKDSISRTLNINFVPPNNFIVLQKGGCIDSNEFLFSSNSSPNYKHYWAFSDSTYFFFATPIKKFTDTGNFFVTHTVTDSTTNCSSSKTRFLAKIAGKPLPFTISGTQFLKHGRQYAFVANGAKPANYTWSVSQTPDFVKANNDTLFLRWNNGFLSATIKAVQRDSNGCKSDTAIFQVWTILNSISTVYKDISVYPVPAKENLLYILNNGSTMEDVLLTVFDINGKQMSTRTLKIKEGENPIDISALAGGVYYLHLQWEQNTSTHKIIKIE